MVKAEQLRPPEYNFHQRLSDLREMIAARDPDLDHWLKRIKIGENGEEIVFQRSPWRDNKRWLGVPARLNLQPRSILEISVAHLRENISEGRKNTKLIFVEELWGDGSRTVRFSGGTSELYEGEMTHSPLKEISEAGANKKLIELGEIVSEIETLPLPIPKSNT